MQAINGAINRVTNRIDVPGCETVDITCLEIKCAPLVLQYPNSSNPNEWFIYVRSGLYHKQDQRKPIT